MKEANPKYFARTHIVLAITLISAQPVQSEDISGQVRVIDGDTFQFIGGPKIRIYGIDSLEKKQQCVNSAGSCIACGELGKAKAVEIIGMSVVSCQLLGKKSYDRLVAICSVGGKDFAQTMVSEGWALAYRSFLPRKGAGHAYVLAEQQAEAAQRGLWGMRFTRPEEWRNNRTRLKCEL